MIGRIDTICSPSENGLFITVFLISFGCLKRLNTFSRRATTPCSMRN